MFYGNGQARTALLRARLPRSVFPSAVFPSAVASRAVAFNVAAMSAVLLMVSACGLDTSAESLGDYPQYESLEEALEASDAVVLGTPIAFRATSLLPLDEPSTGSDDWGDPKLNPQAGIQESSDGTEEGGVPGEAGVPSIETTFYVTEVLSGDVTVGEEIVVTETNSSLSPTIHNVQSGTGSEQIVLFLSEFEVIFSPINPFQGVPVFDHQGKLVVPRTNMNDSTYDFLGAGFEDTTLDDAKASIRAAQD